MTKTLLVYDFLTKSVKYCCNENNLYTDDNKPTNASLSLSIDYYWLPVCCKLHILAAEKCLYFITRL